MMMGGYLNKRQFANNIFRTCTAPSKPFLCLLCIRAYRRCDPTSRNTKVQNYKYGIHYLILQNLENKKRLLSKPKLGEP